jgi:hypothetical protein
MRAISARSFPVANPRSATADFLVFETRSVDDSLQISDEGVERGAQGVRLAYAWHMVYSTMRRPSESG